MKENLKPCVYKLWKQNDCCSELTGTRKRTDLLARTDEDERLEVRTREAKLSTVRITLPKHETDERSESVSEEGSRLRTAVTLQPRTFCRTVRRVTITGKVKQLSCGAEGIPSLKRALSQYS